MSELGWIGLIFLGVGAVQVALAGFFIARTRRFLRTAIDASGTIVELLESRSSEGGPSYQAVVEFPTGDGTLIRWTETMASNPPAGQPGEQLPMKYDPADPRNARISRPFRLWFLSGLFGLLGLVFVVIGAGLMAAGAVA
jgi:Protein of unknown function (DUF3592)